MSSPPVLQNWHTSSLSSGNKMQLPYILPPERFPPLRALEEDRDINICVAVQPSKELKYKYHIIKSFYAKSCCAGLARPSFFNAALAILSKNIHYTERWVGVRQPVERDIKVLRPGFAHTTCQVWRRTKTCVWEELCGTQGRYFCILCLNCLGSSREHPRILGCDGIVNCGTFDKVRLLVSSWTQFKVGLHSTNWLEQLKQSLPSGVLFSFQIDEYGKIFQHIITQR